MWLVHIQMLSIDTASKWGVPEEKKRNTRIKNADSSNFEILLFLTGYFSLYCSSTAFIRLMVYFDYYFLQIDGKTEGEQKFSRSVALKNDGKIKTYTAPHTEQNMRKKMMWKIHKNPIIEM